MVGAVIPLHWNNTKWHFWPMMDDFLILSDFYLLINGKLKRFYKAPAYERNYVHTYQSVITIQRYMQPISWLHPLNSIMGFNV